MHRMEYLFILLLWLIVSAAIHYKYRLKLYSSVKQMGVTVGLFFIVGIAWDLTGGHLHKCGLSSTSSGSASY